MKYKDFIEKDERGEIVIKNDFFNIFFTILIFPFVFLFYLYRRAQYFIKYVFKDEI